MPSAFTDGYLLHDVGKQYYEVIERALSAPEAPAQRLAQLAQQVKGFFVDLTEESGQSLSNHFARMNYVAQAAEIDPKLTYYLHQFDKESTRLLRDQDAKLTVAQALQLGSKALADVIKQVMQLPTPLSLRDLLPADYADFQLQSYTVAEFHAQIRALVLEVIDSKKLLRVRLTQEPGLDHFVHYQRGEYNERYAGAAVKLLHGHFELPVEVNLLGVEVDTEGKLNPQHIILEPDFLVDITSISKCFDATGSEPMKYLLGRLTPFTSSVAMMAGNVANHFLDTALLGNRAAFGDSLRETFKYYPLQYARLNDEDVSDLVTRCQGHYGVIGDCVDKHFASENINCQQVDVEPSFYSERYGIQGRLDVFLPPSTGKDAAIVELKSGKIYRPNHHGVNQEHYVQTLLYDLLVKSVFDDKARPRNFVLYSSDKERPMRYTPPNKAQQYDALAVRNQMMATERLLSLSKPGEPGPLDWLIPDRYPQASGFVKRDLESFYAAYAKLSNLERDYMRAFVGFIAREQRLAKIGSNANQRINGQSALWREALEDKLEGYAILHDLKLQRLASRDGVPLLTFMRFRSDKAGNDNAPALTSFRAGDIVVLYAGNARKRAILRHQVYKGSIVEINEDVVMVRLRASQPDLTRFQRFETWNIEGDLFDSSFTQLYKNLMEFAGATPQARGLVLGTTAPQAPGTAKPMAPAGLTQEQGKIFRDILNARDYYLLWGPPGTGKTSMMLRHLCEHFVFKSKERILVLAYTNRAVDEICRAISKIGSEISHQYLRIGSALSCDKAFVPQLLQERIKHMGRREEVKELLQSQRIVVGTVSSVLGKAESLFELLNFDRLIIDEASQLLEPLIGNLMTRFPRTVLIGDHRQLPAIVTQPESQTRIDHGPLRAIGLTDMRNSLFERLYEQCQTNDWHWAYGQLTRQGRMHNNISDFANKTFYGGSLRGLELGESSRDWQKLPNSWSNCPPDCSAYEELLRVQSFVVVDTKPDLSDKAFRTNAFEAEAIVATIASLIKLKDAQHQQLDPRHVGIITPFRAQIARIRSQILSSDLPIEWGEVAIDTVERFQGASFKIVLLSLCANHASVISRLSSTNHELKDRKLNVALTRARERVITFGNVQLLRANNAAYCEFIDYCSELKSVYFDPADAAVDVASAML